MKPNRSNPLFARLFGASIASFIVVSVHAAEIAYKTEAGSTAEATTATNWMGDVAPGSGDVAAWLTDGDPVTAGNQESRGGAVTISSPVSWLGLRHEDSSGALSLSGSPITLGASGITEVRWELLNIANNIVLATDQPWNISGSTTTITGAVSGNFMLTKNGAATLNIGSIEGGFTHAAGTTNLSGLVGGNLVLNGGTLNVNSGASSAGSLAVSGGTANLAGPVASVSQSGGTVNFGAGASVTSGLQLSGGTANLSVPVAGNSTMTAGTLNLNNGATLTLGDPNVLGTTLNIAPGATLTGSPVIGFNALNLLVLGGAVVGNLTTDELPEIQSNGGSVSGDLTAGWNAGVSTNLWVVNAPLTVGGNVTLHENHVFDIRFPVTPGEFTDVLNYGGTLTADMGKLSLAGGGAYRSVEFQNNTLDKALQVKLSGEDRTWVGGDATNPTFWDVDVTSNWAEGDQKFLNGDLVLFDDTAAAAGPVPVAMQSLLSPLSVTVNNTAKAYSITGAVGTGITGSTGITKNGTNTLSLGGVGSTFTGPVDVNAGTLALLNGEALGFTSGINISAGGGFNLNGHSPSNQGRHYTFNIAGNGTDGEGGVGAIFTTGGGSFSNAGMLNIVLDGNAEIGGNNGRFDIGRSGPNTGVITGNGHTLTKVGSNEIGFRGDASGTPINIVVNQGAIWAENVDTAFGGATGSLTINAGRAGTFGVRNIATPVTIGAAGTLNNQGGGAGTWSGAITAASGATIEAGTEIVLSGTTTVAPGGTVNKTGGSQLTLTGSMTGASVLNVNAGTFQVGNLTSTGSFSADTVNLGNGALLRYRLSGANATLGADVNFANGGSELRQHAVGATDTLTLTGMIGTSTTTGILRPTFGRMVLGNGAQATVAAVNIQGPPATGRGVLEVQTGATLTTPVFNIGQDGSNSGIVNVTGGTVTVPAAGSSVRIGHWNNNNASVGSELNVTAGLFDASATNITVNVGWDGLGSLNVGGGLDEAVAKAWRVQLDANGDSATYNSNATVSENGILEIGAGGLGGASANDFVRMNGGTLASGGSSTWAARIDALTTTESVLLANAGHNVVVSGQLTGDGDISVEGEGIILLGNAGGFQGDIVVEGKLATNGAANGIGGALTVAENGLLLPSTASAPNSIGKADFTNPITINGGVQFDLNATDVTPGNGFNDLVEVSDVTFGAGSYIRPVFVGGAPADGNRYSLFAVIDGEGRDGMPVLDPEVANSFRFSLNLVDGEFFEQDVELVVNGSAADIVWAGDGATNVWDVGGASNWELDSNPTQFFNYDGVSFTDDGDNTVPVQMTGELIAGSLVVNANKDYVWTGTGSLNSASALAKSGTGMLTVLNNNSVAGAVTIDGGQIVLGDGGTAGWLGSTGGAFSVAAGSGLTIDRSNALTLTRAITGAGSFVKSGEGVLTLNTGGSPILPTTVTVSEGTLNLSTGAFGGDRMTGSGVITVNSGAALRISAAHGLGGNNAGFSEAVIVNGGTLTLDSEQYLNVLTLNAATVNGTNEMRTTTGAMNYLVTGSAPSVVAARVSNAFSDSIWNVEDVTGDGDIDFTISGPIINTFGVVKSGAGTMLLSGVNTYTGSTTVNTGELVLADTGRLRFNPTTPGTSNKLTGAGTAEINGGFIINLGAADTTPDSSWTLVDVSSVSYGNTFTVSGRFTDVDVRLFTPDTESPNLHILVDGENTWVFNTETGLLTQGIPTAGESFADWMDGFDFTAFPGADLSASGDADGDGIPNAVEFVIGNLPNETKVENLPTLALVTNPGNGVPDGDYLLFTYRRSTASVDAGVTSAATYDQDLVAPWTTAVDAENGIVIVETVNGSIPGHDVAVYIPRALAAPGTKLFGRLEVTVPAVD